jgi:hypothetical protein
LQRRVPTQRSETHHLLAITEVIPSGGLNACSLSLSLHAFGHVRCWPILLQKSVETGQEA